MSFTKEQIAGIVRDVRIICLTSKSTTVASADGEIRAIYPSDAVGHVKALASEVEAMQARVATLEGAIKAHRSQKADDRCIEDDDMLYAVVGDGIKCDRRVGSKSDMMMNCARFIERRCKGGGWPSYVELEQRLERAEACIRDIAWRLRYAPPIGKDWKDDDFLLLIAEYFDCSLDELKERMNEAGG